MTPDPSVELNDKLVELNVTGYELLGGHRQ